MNSSELLHKCEQLESLKNEIYDSIIEEIKEYCKYTYHYYPIKEEVCRIYIIDSYLTIAYHEFEDEDGCYYELEIPLEWFTDKESMLKDFKNKEKIEKKNRIKRLVQNIMFREDTIKKDKAEIAKLEKELNNE